MRLSLEAEEREEPLTMEEPVLLKMEDWSWAYRVLFSSSKLLIFV